MYVQVSLKEPVSWLIYLKRTLLSYNRKGKYAKSGERKEVSAETKNTMTKRFKILPECHFDFLTSCHKSEISHF